MARPMLPTPMMPTRSLDSLAIALALLCRLCRHVTFRAVVLHRGGLTRRRIAVAAARGALHQEAFARLHLVARRGARLVLLRRPEPHDEARALARCSARDPRRREACLVEAADHCRIAEELIFPPQRETAAPAAGAAGVRHQIEARDAARIFRFKDLDRRDV